MYFPSADQSAAKCKVLSFEAVNAKKSSFCRLRTAQSKSWGTGVLDLPSPFPLVLGFKCRTSLQAQLVLQGPKGPKEIKGLILGFALALAREVKQIRIR